MTSQQMRDAQDRIADKAIAAAQRAEARGQWKAHARHLARLSRILAAAS